MDDITPSAKPIMWALGIGLVYHLGVLVLVCVLFQMKGIFMA